MSVRSLVEEVRSELRSAADPAKAGPMQAYMKSSMPYYGVQTPEHRRLCRRVFAAHPLSSHEEWQAAVFALWRKATHREERYAAIGLTGYKLYDGYQKMKTLPMYEEMIVTGAWWDYVDAIATHRLRELLVRHPGPMTRRMRSWSRSSDLWKRRASILCQVGRKKDTDLDLLYSSILPNLDDREFFIRKAIGWALRDYAWHNPDEIVRFVAEHEDRLSPLSRREALKNVGR